VGLADVVGFADIVGLDVGPADVVGFADVVGLDVGLADVVGFADVVGLDVGLDVGLAVVGLGFSASAWPAKHATRIKHVTTAEGFIMFILRPETMILDRRIEPRRMKQITAEITDMAMSNIA
jgi:hypothetical protein